MSMDPMDPDDPTVEKYARELLDAVRPYVIAARSDVIVVKPGFLALLPEYSTSNPTGVADGKIWKSQAVAGTWMLCEYVDTGHPSHIAILRRVVEVVEP